MTEDASLDLYLYRRHERPQLEPPRPAPERRGRAVDIVTDDGLLLRASLFPARPRPSLVTDSTTRRAPVVIASATGVKRTYYAPFAAWLAARGFDTVTFDYRGIGDSADCARVATMHDWGEHDLSAVVRWASRELRGDRPIAVVGHSVGGQLLGLLTEPERVDTVVTVGAQSGDYRLWPLPLRLAMAALWYGVVPGVTHTMGYLPGALGVGEDLPEGVALEWARWCRTPGYLVGGSGAWRRDGFAQLRARVLALGFEDDPYAPPAAVDALHALYTNAQVERRSIARQARRIGHFGFFRRRFRDTLWRDALAHLDHERG